MELVFGKGLRVDISRGRSWNSWKQGTMHKLIWHSGQWYFVFLLNIRPCVSIVFQQWLHPSAGPGRWTGQWPRRWSLDPSLINVLVSGVPLPPLLLLLLLAWNSSIEHYNFNKLRIMKIDRTQWDKREFPIIFLPIISFPISTRCLVSKLLKTSLSSHKTC